MATLAQPGNELLERKQVRGHGEHQPSHGQRICSGELSSACRCYQNRHDLGVCQCRGTHSAHAWSAVLSCAWDRRVFPASVHLLGSGTPSGCSDAPISRMLQVALLPLPRDIPSVMHLLVYCPLQPLVVLLEKVGRCPWAVPVRWHTPDWSHCCLRGTISPSKVA